MLLHLARGQNAEVAYAASEMFLEHEKERRIVYPSFLYGVFAPSFFASAPDYSALSTNALIYRLLSPTCVIPRIAGQAMSVTFARAHVRVRSHCISHVLRRPQAHLISSPYASTFQRSIALIPAKRNGGFEPTKVLIRGLSLP